jgi:hypothetical protein
MRISRRQVLQLTGGLLVRASSSFAASSFAESAADATTSNPNARFDLDRLLMAVASTERLESERREYVASAVITLFGVTVFSKSGVGNGNIRIEEFGPERGGTVSIEFAAGSRPEGAKGLNRLGYIQEAILEEAPGQAVEAAYVAFMTASDEKNVEQARKAMQGAGNMQRYNAAQGFCRPGAFQSRIDRLVFSSKYSFRDLGTLIPMARTEMVAHEADPMDHQQDAESVHRSTFLYAVRRAILTPGKTSTSQLFFNSKKFRLETDKEFDPATGAHFVEKKIVDSADKVVKLSAWLTESKTGQRTPFRLWYEKGAENQPPLRFDYQARSFLRLAFEALPKQGPQSQVASAAR